MLRTIGILLIVLGVGSAASTVSLNNKAKSEGKGAPQQLGEAIGGFLFSILCVGGGFYLANRKPNQSDVDASSGTNSVPKPAERSVDQKTMLKVLGPAAAIGVLVLLAGLLLAPPGESPAPSAPSNTPKPQSEAPPQPSPSGDADGMTLNLPPLEDAGWKDGPEGGLKIWDVKEGSGELVSPGATVKVHYTGWLTNGDIFDSSVQRGSPISFSLNGVIRGWTVGIPGMRPGGIRRLYIPSELGYGRQGSPPKIPGNAPLVFEVKLLSSK